MRDGRGIALFSDFLKSISITTIERIQKRSNILKTH